MAPLRYRPNEYWTMVKISREKHILVEGQSDKRAFEMFLDELNLSDVVVDSAEVLISSDGQKFGNREKVEYVCSRPLTNLVGFVDREFRGFEVSEHLLDKLEDHMVNGRVVWSRGHSLENYCFDKKILYNPLRAFSLTEHFREALTLFGTIFEKVICDAVAATLAGHEAKLLKVLPKSIDWRLVRVKVESKEIETDLEYWERKLVEENKVHPQQVKHFITRLPVWRRIADRAEINTLRWLCHGHIGLAFIWAAYSRCVFEVSKQQGMDDARAQKEAQRVLKAEMSVRLNVCLETWVRESLSGNAEFPFRVFDLLELEN